MQKIHVDILYYIQMQKELEKNLSNDEVFNAINKIFISLEDDEIRTINESLLLVCIFIIYYNIIYWFTCNNIYYTILCNLLYNIII